MIRQGERRVGIAALRDVPLAFGGAARFQLQNLLAACATAYVQGMAAERIRAGLLTFVPSAAQTPGRLNMIETDRGRVILDYAHNAAAIAGLLDFVAGMPAEYRIAVPGQPLRWVRGSGITEFVNGGAVALTGGMIDITRHLEQESALREQDRRKDQFLAMLSHELRNPLAPIRTAADVLAYEGLTREQVVSSQRIISRQSTQITAARKARQR